MFINKSKLFSFNLVKKSTYQKLFDSIVMLHCLHIYMYKYIHIYLHLFLAQCSSVVRAFAHGAINHQIDISWGGPIELFLIPASALRLV